MKSIKEKAEKHLNSVYAGYDNVLKELVKEGYVEGANYVLECIELYCKEHVVCNTNIKHLIEQLKK